MAIELTIRSPHRFSMSVYLSHKLMRQFYGNNNYVTALKSMDIPSDYMVSIKTVDDYKGYKSDPIISSLLLLELLVAANTDNIVCNNIRSFIASDRILRRYTINYRLDTINDIEFAISCKLDYLSFVRRYMTKRAKNIIARHYFSERLKKAGMAVRQ